MDKKNKNDGQVLPYFSVSTLDSDNTILDNPVVLVRC